MHGTKKAPWTRRVWLLSAETCSGTALWAWLASSLNPPNNRLRLPSADSDRLPGRFTAGNFLARARRGASSTFEPLEADAAPPVAAILLYACEPRSWRSPLTRRDADHRRIACLLSTSKGEARTARSARFGGPTLDSTRWGPLDRLRTAATGRQRHPRKACLKFSRRLRFNGVKQPRAAGGKLRAGKPQTPNTPHFRPFRRAPPPRKRLVARPLASNGSRSAQGAQAHA